MSGNAETKTPCTAAPARLRFHRRRKRADHRLPFFGRKAADMSPSWWDVPRVGRYQGGTITGKALALIYLQHLREHGGHVSGLGILQHIVLDMFGCDRLTNDPELDTLQGQVVGFFCEIDRWLAYAAAHMGNSLDRLDAALLLDAANAGLSHTGGIDRPPVEIGPETTREELLAAYVEAYRAADRGSRGAMLLDLLALVRDDVAPDLLEALGVYRPAA